MHSRKKVVGVSMTNIESDLRKLSRDMNKMALVIAVIPNEM